VANLRHFSIVLVSALALTLSIKTFVAASVMRPNGSDIALTAGKLIEGQGFQLAGLSTFAGRTAVMAQKDSCLLYLIPVSEQGWHQETVRTSVVAGQRLYFVFDSKVYDDNQPRWKPLFEFYSSFALAHAGLGPGYSPVVAVVASDDCDVKAIDWSGLAPVPYSRTAILTHQENEDY